jgi:hypothetical protein
MAPFVDASIQRQFRIAWKVGLSVSSPASRARQEQTTDSPVSRELHLEVGKSLDREADSAKWIVLSHQ